MGKIRPPLRIFRLTSPRTCDSLSWLSYEGHYVAEAGGGASRLKAKWLDTGEWGKQGISENAKQWERS